MKTKLLILTIVFAFLSSCSDDEIKYYELSLSSNIEDVTLDGNGTFEAGKQCTVKASSQSDKVFAGWYAEEELLYPLDNFSFKLERDLQLEARFCNKDETVLFNGSMIWAGHGGFGAAVEGYHPACVKKDKTTKFTMNVTSGRLGTINHQILEGTGTVKIENSKDIVVTPTSIGNFIFRLTSDTQTNPNVLIKIVVED
jgi:hypothetical protein